MGRAVLSVATKRGAWVGLLLRCSPGRGHWERPVVNTEQWMLTEKGSAVPVEERGGGKAA